MTVVEGGPVWIEAVSGDVAASRDFYAALLGWEFPAEPDTGLDAHLVATTSGERTAGIFCPPEERRGPGPEWLVHFTTSDAELTARRVRELGGQVVVGPVEVPGAGVLLVTITPFGVPLAFVRPEPGVVLASGRPGTLAWTELWTPDAEAADAFFGALFGREGRRGGSGDVDHAVHGADDSAAFGRLRTAPGTSAHWTPYFAVDPAEGTDAATRRVVELGGRVRAEPVDSPHGRVSVVEDHEGTVFCLIDPTRTG